MYAKFNKNDEPPYYFIIQRCKDTQKNQKTGQPIDAGY